MVPGLLYDTRRKETLDALRITASNMFAAVLADFRPLYDNHRSGNALPDPSSPCISRTV